MATGLYMSWLTDERYTWRQEIQLGIWHEPYILQQYRANRDSNLWRATREVEKLCEYILHLEGARPMSESINTLCDNCESNISHTDTYPKYRLRLIEETTPVNSGAIEQDANPEFNGVKNFCNKACLTVWINK